MRAHKGNRDKSAGLVSLFFLESASAAAWLGVAALAIADAIALRRLRRTSEEEQEETVTMIVPARNEERNIEQWLRDARNQRVRQLEIVVADDSSQDATHAAALRSAQSDPRVRVLRCAPPPPGWNGKPWAAHQGAVDASTGWLCFSDADVRMKPETLASAFRAARDSCADALSLTPTLECGTWWERQIMPVVAMLIFSALPVVATHEEGIPLALLAGGFMLVRASAYRFIGGHAAVRGSIAEDRDLAERLKGFGFRLRMLDGSELLRVRMYRGLREMWQGFRKNFFEGVRRSAWGAAATVVASFGMLVLPIPILLWLAARRLQALLCRGRLANRPARSANAALAIASGICLGSTILVRALRDRSIGIRTDAASIATTPVAGLFVAGVMAASAWGIIGGEGQRWKGRTLH